MAEPEAPGSQLRPETRTGLELLGLGLLLGAVHVSFRSHGAFTEAGRGGLVDLVGCAFIGAVLWAMLTIRALAAGGSVKDAVDDGLTASAVAAWMVTLAPPRLSNYLPTEAASDFAYAYLPASLVGVLLVNLAVVLWPARTRPAMGLRLAATTAATLVVLGVLLRVVGGGADAGEAALRAWLAAGVAAAVAAGLHVWARRRA
ncbi:MAG: hypothetical protein AB1730_08125 [Myxococcota bacterium]